MKYKLVLVLTIVFVTSCTLFDTRTPEEPDTSDWTFVPPTSPEIAIDNFINSICYKSTDSYVECFAQDKFVFVPSNDAITAYPSFFDNWTVADERQYILSLTTTLGQSRTINVNLTNKNFEVLTADSVVLMADYNVVMEAPSSDFPAEYEGKLLFTMHPAQNGLWAISRWQDFQTNNSSNPKETFSFLKVHFHN